MKMNNIIRGTLIAAAAFMAIPARAQPYAGATVGESRTELNGGSLDMQFLDFGYTDSQIQTDQRDSTFRVFGGYQFNRYLGIEAGYVDFGRYSIRADVVPTGTFERRIKTTGVDVSVVATLPVTRKLALFGRVGAFASERKTSFQASGDVELLNDVQASTARQTKAVFAAGLTVEITRSISMRAEVVQTEKYFDDLLSQKTRNEMYSAGLQYRFR
jgi:OmpA-OmpF porin, OOP family